MYVLSGDVGGTNSRFQLAEFAQGTARVLHTGKYLNENFDDFDSVLQQFLNDASTVSCIEYACIAAAGPVLDGIVKLTNLDWLISEESISRRFNIPSVELVNDLVAAAHGIDELGDQDFVELQKGVVRNQGPAVIIGVGTGFGQTMMVRNNEALCTFASEGGHVDFAPRNQFAVEMLMQLWEEQQHVSVETILCGSGLGRIYHFLLDRSSATVPSPISADAITTLASQGDETAVTAVTQFVGDLAAQAGNVAISYLATAGVYLMGGVVSAIGDKLITEQFLVSFNDKGPMSLLTTKIPVKIIENQDIGLLGAMAIVRKQLASGG